LAKIRLTASETAIRTALALKSGDRDIKMTAGHAHAGHDHSGGIGARHLCRTASRSSIRRLGYGDHDVHCVNAHGKMTAIHADTLVKIRLAASETATRAVFTLKT
jgi:hypothetical protein